MKLVIKESQELLQEVTFESVKGKLEKKLIKNIREIKDGKSNFLSGYQVKEGPLHKEIKNMKKIKILKERKKSIKEILKENNERILDLTKNFDSGFCEWNPQINQYAQSSPEGLAMTIVFVLATQQKAWYDVVAKFPFLMAALESNNGFEVLRDREKSKHSYDKFYNLENFAELLRGVTPSVVYIWKNRNNIYQTFKPLFDVYNNFSGIRKENAVFEMYLEFIKLPNLGFAKAAFATQLVIGRLGCIDSVNINLYKDLIGGFGIYNLDKGVFNPAKQRTNASFSFNRPYDSSSIAFTKGGIEKAKKYVEFLEYVAKSTGRNDISRFLWNAWVEIIQMKINDPSDFDVIVPTHKGKKAKKEKIVNRYSQRIDNPDTNPADAFRKKYIGNITGRDVTRQHHVLKMYETNRKKKVYKLKINKK